MTATTPQPDVKRLIHLAEWAAAQEARRRLDLPSEWDQNHWLLNLGEVLTEVAPCGTACCIAGKVTLEDGWLPNAAVDSPENWTISESEDYVIKVDKSGKPVGDARYVPEVAQEILGLTDDQANRLFDGDNDLDDVLDVIVEILAEVQEAVRSSRE